VVQASVAAVATAAMAGAAAAAAARHRTLTAAPVGQRKGDMVFPVIKTPMLILWLQAGNRCGC